MAIWRAKNKAQHRASQLRSFLDEAEKEELDARAANEKQRLVCDWFSRYKLRFDPKFVNDHGGLASFMTKLELHQLELQVAEFEISMVRVGRDDVEGENFASRLNKGKERTLPKALCKIDSSEQHLGTQIGLFSEKETTTSEKRTAFETTSVPETGKPSTGAWNSGEDAAAAGFLPGLPGAKGEENAAAAAAGRAVSLSLGLNGGPAPAGAGAAPVAFLLRQGWTSAIDRDTGKVYYYRRLPKGRAPPALGYGVMPPRGEAETGGDSGACDANYASIPDSEMSSHA